MAGRHIRDMIVAYGQRDDLKFRRAAQAIISEEEAKRHTVLARELRSLLAANSALGVNEHPVVPEPPVDRDSSLPLASVELADRALDELVLKPATAEALEQLLTEARRWTDLDAAGLPRRNRVLLSGPPGCGKTSAVSALAHELGRPLVTARVEGLMSSYLGETATNLTNLFAFAATGPYVLFLDEFDSLGKMRDDPSDHGELRRVVNAVLQQIDSYRGPSLIVAATNHSNILDTALWRRFDAVIELGLPTNRELAEVVRQNLPPAAYKLAQPHIDKLAGLPHAAAEYFAHAVRRRAVLAGVKTVRAADISAALHETTSRPWL
ncbi:ATP-binding protein [Mycobacteroides abscessus subsp. abscessus]|uniref:AAA family ATPase n=1 Tax=Mycobacteroides abscessus TaxID=36809 RepID=UPI000926DD17|nr:ATP-binding protein [Mycobacteroides abscessus]AWG52261.1 AAA family ATPase [Mycobacteroides abscessus]MBN7551083.1 AAA family ATPase [Mycobacteroides abscessus subsp. abscessus]MDO3099779.1 ATP-binding protein [Mycobacteroides abscessus subsp. abscessus]MDO3187549.1 ATP-binding protein [Mycobacteroides abscessus subsp. abscessus]MDO3192407.1 ATP-binding protein [Mycobacteroides abscessus subsp. abscessus]